MIEKLVRFAIKERGLVLLLACLIFGLGLHSVSVLNVEAYPDPAPPLIEIITQKAGWSAEEIEQQITVPLEANLNGMLGLSHIRSSSLFGMCDIKCYFRYDTSYFADRQEVINRIGMTTLPANVTPALSPTSTIGEILRYELVGPAKTQMELKEINDWVLVRQFKQVPGVIDCTSFGGPTKEYHVDLDPTKLRQYQVSVDQVMDALSKSNSNVGANYLDLGPQSYSVRGVGLFADLQDIREVVVAETNGVAVCIDNLGTVELGRKVPLGRVGRDDQQDIVNGVILMRPGGQSMPTLNGVNKKIEELNRSVLPKGVQCKVYADRTKLINVTTHTVHHTLISGMLLVVFILLAFLGDLRASLIVALTIPLSLCVVFAVMVLTGQSANLISMGAIDFGIIVDASVILIENVHRHLSHYRGPREEVDCVVNEGAAEVVRPIFFSTTVIFVSFLPLFTMQGVEGKIFGPMALTYALALAAALFLALTFSPAAAAFILQPGDEHHEETWLVRVLRRPYTILLRSAVRFCIPLVAVFCVLLALSVWLSANLGGEFMPKLEEGNLWVRATMPMSISYNDATRVANSARAIFRRCPQVITCVSQLGRPDDGTDPTSFFNCEFYVPLQPRDQWPSGVNKDKIIAKLEKQLETEIPGVNFNFSQAIEDNVEESMSGVKGENSVKIVGYDLDRLEELASQVEDILHSIPGAKDVGVFHLLGQPNLIIHPNRKACSRYGVEAGDLNGILSAAVGGTAVTQVLQRDRRFDCVVRLQSPFRDSPESIGRIPIMTKDQVMVPLANLADIKFTNGAGFIYREDNQRYIPIKFSVRDRDLTSVIAEMQQKIAAKVKFPEGYTYQIDGQFQQLTEALARLRVIVPVTVLLIFLILSRSFGSNKDALVVMFSIPLASMGGIVALAIRGIHLSISAAVGFISLAGVCTLEGVLLVSCIKHFLAEGLPPKEAILEGGELRLRPVMMVALGAAIGLLPAATSTGIGSETQRPLATVVVGGMLTSVVVILLVLPAIYRCLHLGGDDAHDLGHVDLLPLPETVADTPAEEKS